jgi:hypothetical protein
MASASQAAAAAINGPEPGPAYILADVTSGGSAPKSSINFLFSIAFSFNAIAQPLAPQEGCLSGNARCR